MRTRRGATPQVPGKMALPLEDAQRLADELVRKLGPACEQILIAGSIRRRRELVGDIELVALPRYHVMSDMFGNEVARESLLDVALEQLGLTFSKNGERQKQFAWRGFGVDLFIPGSPERWGMIATIRTGSADFAKWLVTPRSAGGAMPGNLRERDGRIWQGATTLETPEEADVFKVLGLDWILPEERTAGRWARRQLP